MLLNYFKPHTPQIMDYADTCARYLAMSFRAKELRRMAEWPDVCEVWNTTPEQLRSDATECERVAADCLAVVKRYA